MKRRLKDDSGIINANYSASAAAHRIENTILEETPKNKDSNSFDLRNLKDIHTKSKVIKNITANVTESIAAASTIAIAVFQITKSYFKAKATDNRGNFQLRSGNTQSSFQSLDKSTLRKGAIGTVYIVLAIIAAVCIGTLFLPLYGRAAHLHSKHLKHSTPKNNNVNSELNTVTAMTRPKTATTATKLSSAEESEMSAIVSQMMKYGAQNNFVAMESEMHRAIQRYCVPYISKFKLGRTALMNIESELTILADMATHHKLKLLDVAPQNQVVALDNNGKLVFVPIDDWSTKQHQLASIEACPLVTHVYTVSAQTLLNEPAMPSLQTEHSEELLAEIDDSKGTMKDDIAVVITRITNLFAKTGECSNVGKLLQLEGTAPEMHLTEEMKTLMKQLVTLVNTGSGTMTKDIFIDKSGVIFMKPSKTGANVAKCNPLSDAFESLYKERSQKRIGAAMLTILARMWDTVRSDTVLSLIEPSDTVLPISTATTATTNTVAAQVRPSEVTPQKQTSEVKTTTKETTNKSQWTVEQVSDFVLQITGSTEVQKTFRDNNVNGALLAELTDETLKNDLKISNWGLRKTLYNELRK